MRNADLKKGLEILSYYVSGEKHSLSAEHDQIWFGPTDASVVTSVNAEELRSLGWFVDDESGRWSASV